MSIKYLKSFIILFVVLLGFTYSTKSFAIGGNPKFVPGWVFVYEHDADGNQVKGNIVKLAQAIREGADVKVMYNSSTTGTDVLSVCEWVYAKTDNSLVACMNSSHISVRALEGIDFGFQDNAYHWYTLLNTEGKRDMSRWSVGEHTDRGHTQDHTGIKWFVRIR